MELETERLIIRSLKQSDYIDMYDYINAQQVSCFNQLKIENLEDAKSLAIKRSKDKDELTLVICLKDQSKVIGEVSIHEENIWDEAPKLDTVSLCWMIHPNYQHKGYAYESLVKIFDYLFLEKQVRRIYIYTEDTNKNCQSLCRKLNMRCEGLFKKFVSFTNDKNKKPIFENTYQFAILKDEWKNKFKVKFKLVVNKEDIESIERMAKIVWPDTYKEILEPKQIDYMLNLFLSKKSIMDNIDKGYYYEIIIDGDDEVGFISYYKYSDRIFLSKLYILPNYQGHGYASKAISRLNSFNLPIELTVNKYNLNAYDKYIHLGFRRKEAIVSDIGEGYVMDDYVMVLNKKKKY